VAGEEHAAAAAGDEATALRHEPDYEMRDFMITRLRPTGAPPCASKACGCVTTRHRPLEIDMARIHAFAPDGRVTQAQAARALANGDASEWQLSGGAQ